MKHFFLFKKKIKNIDLENLSRNSVRGLHLNLHYMTRLSAFFINKSNL